MSFFKRMHPIVYESILYGCAFILLLEWLYPLEKIAELHAIKEVAGFAGLCFVLSLFQLRWWVSGLLKAAGLLAAIHLIYYPGSLLDLSWIGHLIKELFYNLEVLFSDNWLDLTPLFRTILVLMLIWLMSYLLHYWFVVMKRVLFFVAATVLYVAVVSTFLDYQADTAIVRVFAVSLISLVLANLMKAVDQEVIAFPKAGQMGRVVSALAAVLALTLAIGLAAPVFPPQWADPVPFMKKVTENAISAKTASSIKRVGYGEDDSQLGGSFVQDYTLLFKATVQTENYWRIETKDYYTGKGWENSVKEQPEEVVNGEIEMDTVLPDVPGERVKAALAFADQAKLSKLVYPYGVSKVKTKEDTDFSLEPISETVEASRNGKQAKLAQYELEYTYPTYDINKLREDQAQDPEAIKILYTQLPEKLPSRIKKLAVDITKDRDSRFEKAKAIEGYFGQNGFSYETANVPVPKKNQDYVDQFLFDSQIGYCDNYSTSMVVMLRTLDIPARWAKGFASGEKVDEAKVGNSTYQVYDVTNANAHSWVEVYFPETGWVPFEPTQGFTNLADFERSAVERRGLDESARQQQAQEKEQKKSREAHAPVKQEKEQEKKEAAAKESKSEQTRNVLIPSLIAGLLILIAVLVYFFRWRLRTKAMAQRLKSERTIEIQEKAYQYLLKLLGHKKVPKRTSETLREYAKRVDVLYGGSEMRVLTNDYEQLVYSGQETKQMLEEFISLWESMVTRIMA